jgi:benzoyl-CoA reductase/2-hydroxyglutaryl-CoA dehydratase subunit BcrC/BadD/HgdB
MYEELLKLCGFEPEEIERERPRVDKAFERAEISAEDISRGESRIREYFDIELLGVRKALGIWMKQFIDLMLAKEEYKWVVYTCYPALPRLTQAINMASEDIYCAAPELTLDMVMGQIFDKLTSILEAAEEHGLPPGLGMCSLNQARLGGIVKGIVPKPDALLSWDLLCDQTPKLDELIHEVYGVPVMYVDNCLDSPKDEYPEVNPRRVAYIANDIRSAFEEVERLTRIEITEEALRTARREVAKLWLGMFEVWSLQAKTDPVPLSHVDLALFLYLIAAPERRTVQEGTTAIGTLLTEAKQRVDQGKGIGEKGAPRVLLLGPQATDPSIFRMFEKAGLTLAGAYLDWVSPQEMTKSKYITFEERDAERQLQYGLYHGVEGIVYKVKQACQFYNVDGVLLFYPFSCRPITISPFIVKKAVEEELNIPLLILEGDWWDTRDYSAGALRTRVETFAEMLKMTKTAKAM